MPERLPNPVRRALREPRDERHVDAAWRRFQQRQASPRWTKGVALGGAGALAVGILAAAVLLTWQGTKRGPLHLTDGPLPRAVEGPEQLRFEDGSRVALEKRTRLEVLENGGHAISFVLESGTVTVDVQSEGPRRWSFECGLATVTVVGTRFTLERSSDRLRVEVSRGAVAVRGPAVPGGGRRLEAGETLEVIEQADEPSERDRPDASGNQPAPRPSDGGPVEEASSAPGRGAPVGEHHKRMPSWRRAAERGDYDEAYAALGQDGLRREMQSASPAELLALADTARLSGHPGEAIEPLERLLSERPDYASGAVAAFTLGRIEADSMNRPARAARAFERAIDLGLARALLPDALARLALARRAAGDDAGARGAAARYLAELPDGRHADTMREVLRATD